MFAATAAGEHVAGRDVRLGIIFPAPPRLFRLPALQRYETGLLMGPASWMVRGT